MSTIRFAETTTVTPEQFTAAVTDFGPGRSALFGNSADKYLTVHERGATSADVTEGSAGIWERLHYDWSDPGRITMKTTDSNVFGGDSGHTYTLIPRSNGTTEVQVVVARTGKNIKGRLIAALLGSIGRRALAKQFQKTIQAIEHRNNTTRPVSAS